MVNLSDISIVDIFKGLILDSLMKDGFICQQQREPMNFFERNKKGLLALTAAGAGLALGPFAVTGAVAALGFGEAGILAGSVAAWMMSLYRGAVAAGSLVSILQSVGAAGLGIGGLIASGLGGGIFVGAVAKAILDRLESSPEELAEFENLASIISEDEPTRVIFDMKCQLLDSNERLRSFLTGFKLAQEISGTGVSRFEFKVDERCLEGRNFLHNHLKDTFGADRVTSERRSYFLNLND